MQSLQALREWLRRPHTCLLCGGATDGEPVLTDVPTHNERLHEPVTEAGCPHFFLPGRVSDRLCPACTADLPWHTRSTCPQCAAPSPEPGLVCGTCLARAPAFDASVAALAYQFPLDHLIPRFKYHSQLAIAPMLADCLVARLRDDELVLPDRVIAMPMHPTRLAKRGLHHAHDIAQHVAQRLGLPLDASRCQRVRDTPPQMNLKFDARRKNVRGAFACHGSFAGERIAIVDDVMTTGTSLDELAATLKKAGAAHVSCWVVARALSKKT